MMPGIIWGTKNTIMSEMTLGPLVPPVIELSRTWEAEGAGSGEGARQPDNHKSVGWLIQQRGALYY